jgi:seryl-tRNA synthetase
MLDHRLFLTEPEKTFAQLKRRGVDNDLLSQLTDAANSRRQLIQQVEELRRQLNAASSEVEQKAKAGQTSELVATREKLRGLKSEIKQGEESLATSENRLDMLLMNLPNLPLQSVPEGLSSEQNRVERVIGTPRVFDFKPQAHDELGEALGIVDFERAAKMSGARFAVLKGAGARLERALIQFMLDNARKHGYEEVSPPLLVRPDAMMYAGQYPKFVGESFETLDREYVLIPTSEIPLVNFHRDEILDEEKLPLRYAAYTPCFRREAGAAGRDTRGLIRMHQFNKVELVSYCKPEDSEKEHERLTGNAEEILQKLELPYRVVSLCLGDLGFTSAKTYDLEVWLPAQDCYREISSCSNITDFQARRSKIRCRSKGDKPRLLHTLNGSGLAVGRTFVAILENYQQADGSVVIPKALLPYFGEEKLSRD